MIFYWPSFNVDAFLFNPELFATVDWQYFKIYTFIDGSYNFIHF